MGVVCNQEILAQSLLVILRVHWKLSGQHTTQFQHSTGENLENINMQAVAAR